MKQYKEGSQVGKNCPKCGKELIFEMSFRDAFSYKTGHYTVDVPLRACPDEKCNYSEEIEDKEVEE